MKTFTIDPTQFLVDTMHLSTTEIGGYVLLMVAQAATEKPIDPENWCNIMRVSPDDDWNSRKIAALFDDVDGAILSHPGIAEQIAERDRQASVNQTRARAGAAARHGKKANGSPELEAPQKPTTLAEPDLMATDDGPEAASIGTVLSPDHALSGTQIAAAKVMGLDMDLLADIFDEFKRYHLSAGTISPDWNASWDKWLDRKRPKKPRAAPRVQLNNSKPQPPATGETTDE